MSYYNNNQSNKNNKSVFGCFTVPILGCITIPCLFIVFGLLDFALKLSDDYSNKPGIFLCIFAIITMLVLVFKSFLFQKNTFVDNGSIQPISTFKNDFLTLGNYRNEKWKIFYNLEDSNSLMNVISGYLTQISGKSSSISELDICRFLMDAITECREYYVGETSKLANLLKDGFIYKTKLQRDLNDVQYRINEYKNKGKQDSPKLLEAKYRLEAILERVDIDLQDLQNQLNRLKKYFSQFSGHLEYLTDTEGELALLDRINKNLNQAQNFLDELPFEVMNEYWAITQNFNTFSHQLANAVDNLNVNLAINSVEGSSMEVVIEEYINRTKTIQCTFSYLQE
jgi:hypothetical protein